MTREQLARTLAAIEQARNDRVEVWIQIVEADGTPAERIYRGSFQRRDSQTRESHSRGE